MKPIIFCDFDGTITLQDTTDLILEAFAERSWHEVEERWLAGKIGSRECLREQMALVRANEADMGRLVDSVSVDPFFTGFVEECVARGFPFHIVSDGFDWVIRRTLSRPELHLQDRMEDLRISASSLQIREKFMITAFPHASVRCTHGCATCKPMLMDCHAKGFKPVVFIGDGTSDQYAARQADLVFARKGKSLAKYCEGQGILFTAFEDFQEVRRHLNRALADMAALSGAPSSLILSYETES